MWISSGFEFNKPILLYSIDCINYYFLIYKLFFYLFDSKLLKFFFFKKKNNVLLSYKSKLLNLVDIFFTIGLTQGSDTCQPVNRIWRWKIPNIIKSPLRSLIPCDVIDFMDEEAHVVLFYTFIAGEIRFTYLFPILDTMLIGGKNFNEINIEVSALIVFYSTSIISNYWSVSFQFTKFMYV